MPNPRLKALSLPALAKNTDILIAVAIVGILVLMIIPLPPVALDLFLSFSITSSLIIILVSMYILKPLEFSVFPSMLLLITLFRLSLNVASTRLILLHGSEGTAAAGRVIEAFGKFVVGGNYVVGMIIFLILVVINFVVITKGAGRIAEVAARFTLDAMPGKQMSIDADLNAGLITDTDARRRRQLIEQEADFYGAMDGASKFVRGDAIAAIVITLINIIGGFVIGIFQHGMSLANAAQTYTLLTVGDGLVTQVPALIVSTAAGIVVTRAASESNLGNDVTKQILFYPRAIVIASLIILFFGLIPGLPTGPFVILSGIAGIIAYLTIKEKKKKEEKHIKEEAAKSRESTAEKVETLLPVDTLEVEVGYGLISLVDTQRGGDFLERIKSIRRQFAVDMGIILPPVRIRDNLQLKPNDYNIILKGVKVAEGELEPGQYLAMNPGTVKEEIDGKKTKEPAFGLPARWIKESQRERAQLLGYTVVDTCTVLATHLTEIIHRNAPDLLTRKEVQHLLDTHTEGYPKLVEELIPGVMTLGGVQKVLQNLVQESVPIRDLTTILETLLDYGPVVKNIEALTEHVRISLARTICKIFKSEDGRLYVLTLHPDMEQLLLDNLQQTEQGSFFVLDPEVAQKVVRGVEVAVNEAVSMNYQPIILCTPPIRKQLRDLLIRFIPNIIVLSHNEIISEIDIQSIGIVECKDAN